MTGGHQTFTSPARTPEGCHASDPNGLPWRNRHMAPRWMCRDRQLTLPSLPVVLPPAPPRLLPAQGLALCLLPSSLYAATPQGQTPDVSPQCQSCRGAIFTQHCPSAKHILPKLYCFPGLYLLPKFSLSSLHSSFPSPPHFALQPREADIHHVEFQLRYSNF